jgi:hypothetical protein
MLGHDLENMLVTDAESPFADRRPWRSWSDVVDAVLKVLCFADPWVPAFPPEQFLGAKSQGDD